MSDREERLDAVKKVMQSSREEGMRPIEVSREQAARKRAEGYGAHTHLGPIKSDHGTCEPDGTLHLRTPEQAVFQEAIKEVLDEVKEMLFEKNRKYGNAALKPARIFSRASPVEQLKVRIDDKLSRLVSGQHDDTEDVEKDLLGYLVILRAARLLDGVRRDS